MSNGRRDGFEPTEERHLLKETQTSGHDNTERAAEADSEMTLNLPLLRESWLISNSSYLSRK